MLAFGLALRGASYIAPGLAGQLARHPGALLPETLSPRDREVLRLLALGHTYAEIGRRMNFSERTIKNCRQKAVQVLGISTRAEVTQWALRNGLVGGDSV